MPAPHSEPAAGSILLVSGIIDYPGDLLRPPYYAPLQYSARATVGSGKSRCQLFEGP